jgi:histone H3/H4
MTEAAAAPAKEMLLVQSKVRDEIRAKDATARVSEEFLAALNDEIYALITRALARCNENKRKTLSKADV